MRILIIAGAVVLLGVLATAFLLRARPSTAEPKSSDSDPAEVSAALRARLLNGSPVEFSVHPDSTIWGVLMETGYPEAAATLVSLVDGTASIYFSTGGGVIGGGQHEDIAAAARRVVSLSKSHLAAMAATTQYPLPKPGRVKFYILTTKGVLTVEEAEETLGAGNHSLSPLFYAAQDVISGLREISEDRKD
jgi:hypothetical protein